jgi:UDP-N-acetylmuramoyl-tripeptide--D-alanyl-D-alanine ligase
VLTFSDTDTTADVRALSAEWQDGAWALHFAHQRGTALPFAHRRSAQRAQRIGRGACALAAGVSLAHIAQGLTAFEPVGGRSRALSLRLGDRRSR